MLNEGLANRVRSAGGERRHYKCGRECPDDRHELEHAGGTDAAARRGPSRPLSSQSVPCRCFRKTARRRPARCDAPSGSEALRRRRCRERERGSVPATPDQMAKRLTNFEASSSRFSGTSQQTLTQEQSLPQRPRLSQRPRTRSVFVPWRTLSSPSSGHPRRSRYEFQAKLRLSWLATPAKRLQHLAQCNSGRRHRSCHPGRISRRMPFDVDRCETEDATDGAEGSVLERGAPGRPLP